MADQDIQRVDLGADDGFVFFNIGDEERLVDIIDAWERYVRLREQQGNGADLGTGMVELLGELGFSSCSQRMALRFFNRLAELIEDLKKNPTATASSPGDTTSPPGEDDH